MSLFVQVMPDLSARDTKMVNGKADRKLVRSQAMKAFRREQRHKSESLVQFALSPNAAWKNHRKQARRASKVASNLLHHDADSTQSLNLPSAHLDSVQEREDSPEDRLSLSCIAHMVQQMRLYIDALTDNFIDGYFAPARDSKSLASIMSHWANPTSPTFETGNNALALLHFGGALRDQRISIQGQRLYLRALRMVRYDVQKGPGGSRTFESMFASAQDLLNCEIYSTISSGFEGWAAHIAGINAIVRISGFKRMNPVFTAFMFKQFRHIATMYALLTRSIALVPEYCFASQSAPIDLGSMEELTRLALDVAKLLESTDCLDASSTSANGSNRQHSTIECLRQLELRLIKWSKVFRQNHLGPCTMMETEPVPDKPHFVFLGLAFQKCLLLLVYEARWKLTKRSAMILQTADRCCNDLLEYIPYLAATTGGEVGKALAVRAPIYFAIRWYQQSDNNHALKECTRIETEFRDAFPHLHWDALLPLSFLAMLWIG